MNTLTDNPAFAVWATTLVVFFAKMFGNSAVQGLTRLKHRRFVRPDDAAFFGKNATPADAEHPLVARMQRAWGNDLENIPLFLMLLLAFVLSGGTFTHTLAYAVVYTVARIGHTVFYAFPKQPHRNIMYQVGILTCFVLSGHLLTRLFA